ncbi:MAG: DUF4123 domain-containing protein [Myxococcota bacterium]
MSASPVRLIIEVCHGPSRGLKAAVEPGGAIRVGREAPSHLVVSKDRQLSAVHFEIAWDGTQAVVRATGVLGITLVEGLPTDEAKLTHGSWIRAGRTDFRTYIEGNLAWSHHRALVDPSPLPAWWEERASRTEEAQRELQPALQRRELFAVVDSARDDRIMARVRASVDLYQSLYEGPQAETLAHVAPFLVRLDPSSLLGKHLLEEGRGRRWGIFLHSRLPFRETRRHLRRFLYIAAEGRPQPLYFRFYDPTSLYTVCRASRRIEQTLVGPFEALWFEDPESGRLRSARRSSPVG